MSGGHFNYFDGTLKTEMFGWTDKPHNVLEDRELSELTWDLLNIIHAYDYYVCGDTCEETYLKKKAEFKKKWFSNRGVTVRRIVDESIAELKSELYETFQIKEVTADEMCSKTHGIKFEDGRIYAEERGC